VKIDPGTGFYAVLKLDSACNGEEHQRGGGVFKRRFAKKDHRGGFYIRWREGVKTEVRGKGSKGLGGCGGAGNETGRSFMHPGIGSMVLLKEGSYICKGT